jgi:hypothetical protein
VPRSNIDPHRVTGFSRGEPTHVLDDVGLAGGLESPPGGDDQLRVLVVVQGLQAPCTPGRAAMRGTHRTPVVLGQVLDRVALVELVGVAGLGVDVHPDDLKAGVGVALGGAALAAEQVQQAGLAHSALISAQGR